MRGLKAIPLIVTVFMAVMAFRIVSGRPELPNAVVEAAPLQWYEGGTLHAGTMSEWLAAADRDRLATAADFAAKLSNGAYSSMNEFKPHAMDLERCISKGGSANGAGHLKVTEIAATCSILMSRPQ